jgi:hypothetical protein
MFGRKLISLGKPYMLSLLISVLHMLFVGLSRSATEIQVHSVSAWRPSLQNRLGIGALVIEPEGVSEILPWTAQLVTRM